MKVERKKTSDSLTKQSNKTKGDKTEKSSGSNVSGIESIDSTLVIKHSIFSETLNSIEEIKTIEELKKTIKEIESAGDIFKRYPTFTNLNTYKNLIQKFMTKIVKDSYKVNSQISRRIDREDKILTTIEKVNKELEEIAEDLLNKQIDKIKLAAKIDEIRGLLVDLIF
ncbi:MAG TPA: YaaR family protein [bacterium]|nr:YaaR family protein [bacterium]HOL47069.1 YaaR family protein [bacterium]HPQ18969.1 YaaR family protein [bacterium]